MDSAEEDPREPVTFNPAERAAIRQLAIDIVESVRRDAEMPLGIAYHRGNHEQPKRVLDARLVELLVFKLAREIEALRREAAEQSERHEKALDYLAFMKGDCDQHAIAWEIALGNMVLGDDYEAKPAPRESHALGEEG